VPVNPKSGTIFDYESVTSIGAIARLAEFLRQWLPPEASVASPTDARENRFGLLFEAAMVPAVTTCPTCVSTAATALKRRRI
jgi:hypothetical protein